ncbi:hypothetical protein LJR219_000948 [Phenylobacterium sp. LjRoot219]|uniref:hypothetical protein n=1 Tax=Phenylobacterium sp. LjRoot219 TaxID=3342283 RepID=UPI003ECD6137
MDYRFVTLNSAGEAGHAEDWSCASDVEAIERASHSVPSFGGELWRGDQRISVFAGPLSHTRPNPRSTTARA